MPSNKNEVFVGDKNEVFVGNKNEGLAEAQKLVINQSQFETAE